MLFLFTGVIAVDFGRPPLANHIRSNRTKSISSSSADGILNVKCNFQPVRFERTPVNWITKKKKKKKKKRPNKQKRSSNRRRIRKNNRNKKKDDWIVWLGAFNSLISERGFALFSPFYPVSGCGFFPLRVVILLINSISAAFDVLQLLPMICKLYLEDGFIIAAL